MTTRWARLCGDDLAECLTLLESIHGDVDLLGQIGHGDAVADDRLEGEASLTPEFDESRDVAAWHGGTEIAAAHGKGKGDETQR